MVTASKWVISDAITIDTILNTDLDGDFDGVFGGNCEQTLKTSEWKFELSGTVVV